MTFAEYINYADERANTLALANNLSGLQQHLESVSESGFKCIADRWNLLVEGDGIDQSEIILKALSQLPNYAPASAYWPYVIAARWSWNFMLARYAELLSHHAILNIHKGEMCNHSINAALYTAFMQGLSLEKIEHFSGNRLWVRRRLEAYREARYAFRSNALGPPVLSLHVPMNASVDTTPVYHMMKELAAILRSDNIAFEVQAQSAAIPALPLKNALPSISYHTISELAPSSIVHIKTALYSDLLAVDSLGYSGWSELINLRTVPTLSVVQRERAMGFRLKRVTKYDQSESTVPEGDVLIALQTLPDSVQRHANIPMLEMLDHVCTWCQRHSLRVIVKRHPKCMSSKVTEAIACLPQNTVVTQSSIFNLFRKVRVVVTVNSAVGFEAATFGVPVITCGISEYRLAAYEAYDLPSLDRALETSLRDGPPQTARDFVDYYLGVWTMEKKDAASRILPLLLKEAVMGIRVNE